MVENVATLFEIEEPPKYAATAIEKPPIILDMLPWPPLYQNSNQVIFPHQVVDDIFLHRKFFSCEHSNFIYVLDPISRLASKVSIKGFEAGDHIKTTQIN